VRQDCGSVAVNFFRGVRQVDPTASDDAVLDAFTYLALRLANDQPVRGRQFLPVYAGLLVGSLVMVNATDSTLTLIAGWLVGSFAMVSLFGVLRRPR
jgi:hypothetical protein